MTSALFSFSPHHLLGFYGQEKKNQSRTHRKQIGFSSTELLVTCAIVMVLAAVGIPKMAQQLDGVRMGIAAEDLMTSLSTARIEAIMRNANMVVCKSPDGIQCATSGTWAQGWMVFADKNANSKVDSGEQIVSKTAGQNSNFYFSSGTATSNYISFNPMGVPRTSAGGLQNGSIELCILNAPTYQHYKVIVSTWGRVRTEKVKASSCG